jgi:hypothetical protein
MKETETRPQFVALLAIIVAFLVILAGMNVVRLLRAANQTARDSAHSALWQEINDLLKAREATGEFPVRLEDLPLTFPDNGSPELLSLVDYRREENGCQVSTIFRGEKLEKRYGDQP